MSTLGIIKTNSILDMFVEYNQSILSHNKSYIDKLKFKAEKEKSKFSFLEALKKNKEEGKISLIAEIKKSSPSEGNLKQANVIDQAKIYEMNKVTAISVLTQPFKFDGSLKDLRQVSSKVLLPTLRKDFITDELEIYEAKLCGASAILLIATILEKGLFKNLYDIAKGIGLDVLVEVHTEEELGKVLNFDVDIIGVNSRNLQTLKIDLKAAGELMKKVPKDKIHVAESGIETQEDLAHAMAVGADAVLIGTAIMKSEDPGAKIKEFLSINNE